MLSNYTGHNLCIGRILRPSILVGALVVAPMMAQAGIREYLDGQFAKMTATAPTTGSTDTRHYVFGGRYRASTPQRNINLYHFSLPNFSGSCSGIDMYFGGFSVASTKQIQDLMKAIIAGAPNYAFGLAMDVISPAIRSELAKIMSKVEEYSQHARNTCQATRWLFSQGNADGRIEAGARSLVAWLPSQSDSDVEDAADTETKGTQELASIAQEEGHPYFGNPVWRALISAEIGDRLPWFDNFIPGRSANEAAALAFMSMIGYYVADPNGYGGGPDCAAPLTPEQDPRAKWVPRSVSMEQFLNPRISLEAQSGNPDAEPTNEGFTIFECDSYGDGPDDCLCPLQRKHLHDGIDLIVADMLVDYWNAVVTYGEGDSDEPFSDSNYPITQVASLSVPTIVNEIAGQDAAMTENFLRISVAPVIAADWRLSMAANIVEMARHVGNLSEDPMPAEYFEAIQILEDEFNTMRIVHGDGLKKSLLVYEILRLQMSEGRRNYQPPPATFQAQ